MTKTKSEPLLPAKRLEEWCYNHMFYGCRSLAKKPFLPAKCLPEFCYYKMLDGTKFSSDGGK